MVPVSCGIDQKMTGLGGREIAESPQYLHLLGGKTKINKLCVVSLLCVLKKKTYGNEWTKNDWAGNVNFLMKAKGRGKLTGLGMSIS